MKKRELNILLVRQIIELSDETLVSVLRQVDIPYTSWHEWIDLNAPCPGGNMPVQALVDVCNVLRVPIRLLFKREDAPAIVPSVRELYLPCGVFQRNILDMDKFMGVFGAKSKTGKPIDVMMKMLGFSVATYNGWKKRTRNLRVFHLLSVCEVFGYDVFDFLIDPNKDVVPATTRMLQTLPPAASAQEIVVALRNERDELRKNNTLLTRTNTELRGEIRRWKENNAGLAGRLNALEHELALLRAQITNGLYTAPPYPEAMVAEAAAPYHTNRPADGAECPPDEKTV